MRTHQKFQHFVGTRMQRNVQQGIALGGAGVDIGAARQELRYGIGIVTRYREGQGRPTLVDLTRARRVKFAGVAGAAGVRSQGFGAERAQLGDGGIGTDSQGRVECGVVTIVGRVNPRAGFGKQRDVGGAIGARGIEERGAVRGIRSTHCGAMRQQQLCQIGVFKLCSQHQWRDAEVVDQPGIATVPDQKLRRVQRPRRRRCGQQARAKFVAQVLEFVAQHGECRHVAMAGAGKGQLTAQRRFCQAHPLGAERLSSQALIFNSGRITQRRGLMQHGGGFASRCIGATPEQRCQHIGRGSVILGGALAQPAFGLRGVYRRADAIEGNQPEQQLRVGVASRRSQMQARERRRVVTHAQRHTRTLQWISLAARRLTEAGRDLQRQQGEPG